MNKRKFKLLTKKTGVETTLVFAPNQVLIGIEFENADAIIEPNFFYYVVQKMYSIEAMNKEVKAMGYELEELEIPPPKIPTFDEFYDKYDYKFDRKRANDSWDKLKDVEKINAVKYIPIYNSERIRSGVAKMYPKTYLNAKVWK